MHKNKKALSPVVAAIILIAVTVAVSLAVAAWVGALTFGFMGSSSLTITSVTFNGQSGDSNNTMVLSIKNTGTKTVTIGIVKINDKAATVDNSSQVVYIPSSTGKTTLDNVGWVNGDSYKINVFDVSGTGVGATQQNAPGEA